MTTPDVDAASVATATAAPRRAAPPLSSLSLAGAIVTVAQRLAGDGYKGEGCRRQRRDLATRQEACNPNCAIVHEALTGNSFLAGSPVSSLLCFPGE